MSRQGSLRRLAERLTRTHIYRVVPRGTDLAQDIADSLPLYQVGTAFDVGANAGQSTKVLLARFPGCHVYCFEPASSTFRQLQENLGGNARVDCYRLALGSSEGTATLVRQGSSETFFLLDRSEELPMAHEVPTEAVDVVTLDGFCRTKGIGHIHLLQIDAEGSDLDVLRGAMTLLSEQRIDLVQVEAGMNPYNRRHVPLESLKAFLESRGYFLFGIYDQVSQFPTGEPHLRRANPVFISRRTIERNRIPSVR